MRAGWTFNDIQRPPFGVTIWALIENPTDREPYLIEAVLEDTDAALVIYDGKATNYLPPTHTMIAWRRV